MMDSKSRIKILLVTIINVEKMKLGYFFFSIFWISFMFSCDSSKNKKSGSEQESLFSDLYGPYGRNKIDYHIDDKGWNVVLRTHEEEEIFYSLEKVENDTIKYLILLKSKFDNKVRVDSYGRIFKVNDETHEIVMKLDTFYYFKENTKFKKTFIIGEYNYRFDNALLSSSELDYYMLYSDSLGSIRGDNLQKLPSLSPKERLKLQELTSNPMGTR
uniref:hypothetical protein n=2 Tax=Roseivirga sp. TaxID=1964215 RepID=UPI0040478BD1